MSTNFLPFGSVAGGAGPNQETDSQYAVDPLRLTGAPADAILPSPLSNKAWYQWSMFCSAFATSLAGKGFVVSDASFTNLVAVFNHVLTTADEIASIAVVAPATSTIFNAATAGAFWCSLNSTVISSSSLINAAIGQILTFILTQDATGNRAFPWPPSLSYTAPICPQPNSYTVQQFQVIQLSPLIIIPIGPLTWLTANGVIYPPPANCVIQVSANGNVQPSFVNLTEVVNAGSGPLTRYLYTAVGYTGFTVNGKNLPPTGGPFNTVTYVPIVPGQTIDGFSSFTVNVYQSIEMQSTGSNWVII